VRRWRLVAGHPVSAVAALLVLAGVLVFAVVRPRGLPEAVGAVPGAVLLVGVGVVSAHRAGSELVALGPTIGFLAAVLVLAHLADEHGSSATSVRWSGGRPVGRRGGCCG